MKKSELSRLLRENLTALRKWVKSEAFISWVQETSADKRHEFCHVKGQGNTTLAHIVAFEAPNQLPALVAGFTKQKRENIYAATNEDGSATLGLAAQEDLKPESMDQLLADMSSGDVLAMALLDHRITVAENLISYGNMDALGMMTQKMNAQHQCDLLCADGGVVATEIVGNHEEIYLSMIKEFNHSQKAKVAKLLTCLDWKDGYASIRDLENNTTADFSGDELFKYMKTAKGPSGNSLLCDIVDNTASLDDVRSLHERMQRMTLKQCGILLNQIEDSESLTAFERLLSRSDLTRHGLLKVAIEAIGKTEFVSWLKKNYGPDVHDKVANLLDPSPPLERIRRDLGLSRAGAAAGKTPEAAKRRAVFIHYGNPLEMDETASARPVMIQPHHAARQLSFGD